jgi:hypothetical protein
MITENFDNENEEQLQENLAKYNEFISNMDPDELFDRLVKAYESTDVILEGYNLVTNINEGHGIAIAGLIRLRAALEETILWMDKNLLEDEEELIEDEDGDEL